MPSWPTAERPTPSALLRRIAEYTPSGTEMPRATIVEQMTSGAVTVSFSPSWLVTVEPVSADSPKSPVRTPPIQSKYWVSRAVESELGADLGQPLGRDLGAGDDHGEVTGDEAQQGEHDDAGDQQGEHQQAESPDQEPRHSSVPSRTNAAVSALHGDVEGVEAGVGVERRVARDAGAGHRHVVVQQQPHAGASSAISWLPGGAVRRTRRDRATPWPGEQFLHLGLSYSQ